MASLILAFFDFCLIVVAALFMLFDIILSRVCTTFFALRPADTPLVRCQPITLLAFPFLFQTATSRRSGTGSQVRYCSDRMQASLF